MQRLPGSFSWLRNSFSRASWSCGYVADLPGVPFVFYIKAFLRPTCYFP